MSSFTLANGQRVVVVEDPNARDVQVTVRFAVGAIDDGEHPGIAHLVEHLMFEQVLDGQPLFTHFEDAANSFNAYTSFDATTYISRAPASKLDTLIALEAARYVTPCESITNDAFEREREVVLNELNEKNQTTAVFGALYGVLYPDGHPYRQAVGGTAASVGAITREQACAFAAAHYVPSNSVLVISGPIGGRAKSALAPLERVDIKRAAPARRSVPQVAVRAAAVSATAPIDKDVLVLAWPLPVEPELQAKVRAVAAVLVRLVDSEVQGTVAGFDIGDRSAPIYGLAMLPADGETLYTAGAAVRRGVERLPNAFVEETETADVVFARARASAIYGLYSSLEDGSDRDLRLAAYVLAGRDPNQAFAQDLAALEALTREECAYIAATYLGAGKPAAITLAANPGKKLGQQLALHKPFHDIGQRRAPPDPALARKPADAGAAPASVAHTTRTLPNGLKVVLVPTRSVPTVDVRLIFRAGTADEPAARRGLATLTAHALTWDLHHFNDVLLFTASGAYKNVDVATDRTTFSVQGMSSQLDVLLSGLRRLVRDGTFDEDSAKALVELRRAAKRADDEGMLTDAWRVALFGADHPYTHAGIARHAMTSLTLDDAAQFRASYYTPANAALVIAGNFDPDVAARWIDYLFADWEGTATARPTTHTTTAPASIGKIDDLSMVQLRIALPAGNKRAEELVAAEMIAEIARDVRFQLAAGYSVDAQLSERRLGYHYVIGGWIDAGRAASAVELIRDRFKRLREDHDEAARAFVTARKHVIAQLLSSTDSAGSLANRIEQDIELERDPMNDVATAARVGALTIDAMAPTLAELDLSRATVLMRGPAAELAASFAALGRKPTYVEGSFVVPPSSAATLDAPLGTTSGPVRRSEVEPALTERPPTRLLVMAGLHVLAGTFEEDMQSAGGAGKGFSLHGGYRLRRGVAAGARIAVADYNGENDASYKFAVQAIDAGGFVRLRGRRGYWLEGTLGLHLDHISDRLATRTNASLGYGVAVGSDLLFRGPARFGAMAGVNAAQSGSLTVFLGILAGI